MKTATPWSVKGIESEAREAAKDAARRSGLTLGEWLNSAILEHAEGGGTKPRAMHPLVRDRFSSIAEELAMMTAERPPASMERTFERSPAFGLSKDAVIERIENNERFLSEALGSVNERLKALNAEIARQAENSSLRTADAGDYAALEAAVRNIIGHLETSERRTHESIHAVQAQLETFSAKGANEETGKRLQQIESLIDGLALRLEQRERGGASLQSIESQVKEFGEQIHSLKSSSEQLVERAQSAAALSLKGDLAELEKHIAALGRHVESSSVRLDAFNSDFIRLRKELADLKSEMGNLAQQAQHDSSSRADSEDLKAVQKLVAQLSERVEQLPLGTFERRLQDVAKRITEVEIRGRALPQASEIFQKFEELEQRLAVQSSTPAADGLHDELQRHFSRVDERLEAAHDRLNSIESIERAISQLFQAVEDNRADVHELAEDAARRVVSELQQSSAAPGMPPAELATIEQALESLRQQSFRSEQQTQETFDALHDTLEEIVNRLAEIEGGQLGSEQPAQPEQEEPPKPQDVGASMEAEESPAQQEPEAVPLPTDWHHAVHEHLVKAMGELDAKAPAYDSGSSADLQPEEPFAGEEEPQTEPPSQSADADSGEENDFIAAARRAAQSAAQGARLNFSRSQQPAPQVKGAAARTRSALSQLASSLFHKQAALKPRHPRGLAEDIAAAADSTTVAQNNGRRRLLIAALLLLAAVSAFAVRSGYKQAPVSNPPNERQSSVLDILTGSLSKITETAGTAENTLPLPTEIAPEALRLAAMKGQAEAQFVIAGRYLDGTAGEANPAEAAKWYRKAALQELPPAQYRLATLFERGAGVEQSATMAKYWYERAAMLGNIKAMHNLGVLLAQDNPPDHNGAARWFAAAASRGLKDSQYNLALLYEGGLGVQKDPAEAFFWYLAASEQGDSDASSKARDIASALPEPIASGIRERLKLWQPMKAETKANAVSLPSAHG